MSRKKAIKLLEHFILVEDDPQGLIKQILTECKKPPEPTEEKCKWTHGNDNYDDYWSTECGNAFVLIEGTPKDNKMKYCPYCGKLIEQVPERKARLKNEVE